MTAAESYCLTQIVDGGRAAHLESIDGRDLGRSAARIVAEVASEMSGRGGGKRIDAWMTSNTLGLTCLRTKMLRLEARVPTRFYFATPHHSWERGTNENTNGLLRQYLPKGVSMADLTQHDCNRLAAKLNRRPRKRLSYRTPEECYEP